MKAIDTIKVYVKHPNLIGYSIKESYFDFRDKFYNWLKRIVYKYEANLQDEYVKWDDYDYIMDRKAVKYAIYNPASTVTHEIELLFQKRNIFSVGALGIMSIETDTQDENIVFVTIKTRHPGMMIGTGGETITALTKRLTHLFGRQTEIKLVEVTKDLNEPKRIY